MNLEWISWQDLICRRNTVIQTIRSVALNTEGHNVTVNISGITETAVKRAGASHRTVIWMWGLFDTMEGSAG